MVKKMADKERLKELKKLFDGQLPIENANKNGRIGWEMYDEKSMKNISPGTYLLQYAYEVLKDQKEHLWAAYQIRDRLELFQCTTQTADKAFGLKRLNDPRWMLRRHTRGMGGLSMVATIVQQVKQRKVIDMDNFEAVADILNNFNEKFNKDVFKTEDRKKIRLTGSTVSDIYYESYKDPIVLKELEDFRKKLFD
tara:strand:+ start:428 stop:1012 length:585 start_codon:yes stop_codon:yes gene_type:complete